MIAGMEYAPSYRFRFAAGDAGAPRLTAVYQLSEAAMNDPVDERDAALRGGAGALGALPAESERAEVGRADEGHLAERHAVVAQDRVGVHEGGNRSSAGPSWRT
ncbi:MAG: hypothetical protein R3A52_06160 [Polyangiales bacterium]